MTESTFKKQRYQSLDPESRENEELEKLGRYYTEVTKKRAG